MRPRRLLVSRGRSRRTLIVAIATVLFSLVSALGVLAYWTTTGSGTASASTATLAAPSITGATPGPGTVALDWSAITPPAAGPVTYYVTRDDAAPEGDCPPSSSPAGVTSCTDAGLSAGAHTYTVTARWRTWTSTSGGHTVSLSSGAATKLAFLTDPFTITTAQTSDTVTVERQDVDGNPVSFGAAAVSLSTTSTAGVFRNTDDDTTISSVQIPDGSSSASFRYRDGHAGAPVLTASSAGLASAHQTETVNKGDQTITFGALADRRLDQSPF